MQQLSHHTLNSALVFWTFITFIVPPGFVWLTRLLLKARDDSACIVCLMSTIFPRTEPGLFLLLRCGRGQTGWACGTSGSEHRDTTACRPWAIEKYSTNLTSIRKNEAG